MNTGTLSMTSFKQFNSNIRQLNEGEWTSLKFNLIEKGLVIQKCVLHAVDRFCQHF